MTRLLTIVLLAGVAWGDGPPSLVGRPAPARVARIAALLDRARAGDADAQINLGAAYRDGTGVPRDYAESLRWYGLAVTNGSAAACDHLGFMHLMGWGTPVNFAEAARLFEGAAQGDVPRGLGNLAELELLGLGLPTARVASAWAHFQRAASLGDDSSFTRLATLSLFQATPLCPPAELASQMEALRSAGSAGAARVLGLQHYLGLGAAPDRVRAEALWREAEAKDRTKPPLLSCAEWAALRDRKAEPGSFVFLDLAPISQGMNLCAATAGAIALRGLGIPADPLALKARCPHSPLGTGTAWDQLADALRSYGVTVELATFGLDDAAGRAGWERIRAELDAGRPVIVDVRRPGDRGTGQGAHSVVAMGYDAARGLVWVQNSAEPLPGVEVQTVDEFLHRWNSRWYMPSAPAECRPALFLRKAAR